MRVTHSSRQELSRRSCFCQAAWQRPSCSGYLLHKNLKQRQKPPHRLAGAQDRAKDSELIALCRLVPVVCHEAGVVCCGKAALLAGS